MRLPLDAFAGAFVATLALRVGLLGLGGLWLTGRAWFRRRRVYGLEVPPGQARAELRYGLWVVAFDAVFLPLVVGSGAARFVAPSLASALATVAFGFVANELWFYASHRLLHTRALYFIHAQHHVARVTDPMTTLSFSLAEHVIAVVPIHLAMVAASHYLPLSAPGMLAFGLLTELGNLYGHLNVEVMPSGFARALPGRLFIAPTFHALHHARYTGHYGLYTRVLDRLFGTEFDDYEALQAQTGAGRPLGSLAERGAAPSPAAPAAEATR